MLPPLATQTDAVNLGFTVDDAALMRASIRIRGHVRQQITVGASTIVARGPIIRLPQRPVTGVESVTLDGAAIAYTETGSNVIEVDSCERVTVTYTHGFVFVPDDLVELVCQVATRLAAPTDGMLAAGAQQATAGPFTVGLGWDAWKAQSGLTAGDKETLRRYWPDVPRTIPLGRP